MNRFLVSLVGTAIAGCAAASPDDLEPFPAASDGQTRHVIRLPALEDETTAKLELVVGKDLEVDCNQHWFGGSLTSEVVQGWGYNYYVVDGIGGPASTLKACPGVAKEIRFVPVRIGEQLLRYNSRLPVVVYAPDGFEVRYRIWQAGDAMQSATVE